MPTPITELIKLSSTNNKEQITKVDRFTIKELRVTNTDTSDRRVFLFIAKYAQSKSGYRRKRGGDRTTIITSSQLGDSEYFSLVKVEIPAGTTLVVLDKDFFIPENHYIFAQTANPEAFDIVINGYREEYQTQ